MHNDRFDMLDTDPSFRLRKLMREDKDFFFQLYTNLDVLRFISNPKTEKEILAAFESRLIEWNLHSEHWLCLVIEDIETHRPMGLIGFCLSLVNQQRVGEIGYLIDPTFSGKGIATSALKMLLSSPDYAQIRTFIAVVTEGNIASEKVLVKNGFSKQKVITANYEINGFVYDDICYELNR
ncbi:TPA: GNAT family N-acetyltransferase [Providencia stuartii]|nr:GNAT family N-acetyltransferase [Providencia sp. PROV267]QET98758.1 GNAT family N-acetyltransferase [Providencia stuartii]HEM8143707.1 GNAT family N-acetyltransferase [Providencia stuartii]HEM8875819.1 GNAT family N-acetyltransferase [Providencia stuartii]